MADEVKTAAVGAAANLKVADAAKTDDADKATTAVTESPAPQEFIFATRNIPNFKLGPWQFVGGQFRTSDPEEAEKIRVCIKGMAPVDQLNIAEIDMALAEKLSANVRQQAQQGGTDSSELRRAMDAAKTAGATGL